MTVNKVILIGNVGRDPQVRATANQKTVVTLSVCTSEKWTDSQGKRQSRDEWHQVVFFDRLADRVAEYVKKGQQLYIEGKNRTRSWDKNGEKRYVTEVHADYFNMLGGSRDSDESKQQAQAQRQQHHNQGQNQFAGDAAGGDNFNTPDPFAQSGSMGSHNYASFGDDDGFDSEKIPF